MVAIKVQQSYVEKFSISICCKIDFSNYCKLPFPPTLNIEKNGIKVEIKNAIRLRKSMTILDFCKLYL